MPRINLLGGAYQALGVIANAQRCVNLVQEPNQKDAPSPITHYLTPGLDLLTAGPSTNPVRLTYRASNGVPYAVIGGTVYLVNSDWSLTTLGTLTNLPTPVAMADNGLVAIIVDGTTRGWAIDLATNAFAPVTDPNFLGSIRVDYIDTYLVFDQPNTANMYISLSEADFDMFTGTPGAVFAGEIASGGTSYPDGAYINVPFTGGTGTHFTANITVSGGTVTQVTGVDEGQGYVVGDALNINPIPVLAISAPGTLYTDGTYTDVPLTGGSGTGAQATVVISGGEIVVVTLTQPGTGYLVSNVLSALAANLGGTGSGFTTTVTALDGSGFVYSVVSVHGAAFDPLDIAAKSGYPDFLAAVIVMHREIWLIGTLTTEIWYDSGAADFPFQAMPGAFVEHGCIASYSVAAQDLSVFWLSQDKQGQAMVLEGSSYTAHRISTHAIENEIRNYPNLSDAIGFCYQEEGHVYYVLTFPAADATWVYDKSAGLWHQRAWTDDNGVLHRHRANCCMNAYNTIVCGDWQNGNLYHWDMDTYTDNGQPISRIRSMPHLVEDLNRVFYTNLLVDLEVGMDTGTVDGADISTKPPMISLRWSDNRGVSYGNRVEQSAGAIGQYLKSVQFRRLGMARDRVFEVSWSFPAKTSLNGVIVTTQSSAS